jgi:hypothetical protein
VKDSVVGEERVARYLLTVLNARSAHLRWKSEVHFSGISDSQSLIRSLLFIIAHVTRESLAQIIWSPEHFFQCLKHEWSKKHHGILLWPAGLMLETLREFQLTIGISVTDITIVCVHPFFSGRFRILAWIKRARGFITSLY